MIEQNHPRSLTPCKELASVKMLCCDVDGVLTDGGFYYDKDGVQLMRFHVQDGLGLKQLMASGVKTCFISQSNSPIISTRANVLGVHYCLLGVEDKSAAISSLLSEEPFGFEAVCHIADDINDLTLLRSVGVPIAVSNAVADVMRHCKFVTGAAGGTGAVRELCDAIELSRNHHGNDHSTGS